MMVIRVFFTDSYNNFMRMMAGNVNLDGSNLKSFNLKSFSDSVKVLNQNYERDYTEATGFVCNVRPALRLIFILHHL